MLFGYRGSEVVDVDAVEDLISRVAQLQNDLPQVALARPVPGARRRATASPCSPRAARVDPVADPRSDWFVRRMPSRGGGHHPGLSGRADCTHA